MTATIEAIYERGILRPLDPLALPEGARVEVIIVAGDEPREGPAPAAILASIAALPEEGTGGFAGRDHDSLLYGPGEPR